MAYVRLFVLCLIAAGTADAQEHSSHHHRGHSHSWHHGSNDGYYSTSPYGGYASPVMGGKSYPLVAISGYGHHHHDGRSQAPIFISTAPVLFPVIGPSPAIMPTVSVMPIAHPNPVDIVDDPAKRPPKPSSPAGKLKSLEYQTQGDEQLRKHLWAQAYMRYRSAIDAASDRGEARFRQAFTYSAMQHYSSAVREFKRGLFLDPGLPVTGIRLAALFGPGSEAVRTSILHKIADWVREDSRDPDRLFLLGVMLHYEDDPRCLDVLKAAQRMAGGRDDHITALLAVQNNKPAPAQGKPPLLPELPVLPDGAVPAAPKVIAEVNLGDQLVLPGVPALSNQATPPIIAPVREPKKL